MLGRGVPALMIATIHGCIHGARTYVLLALDMSLRFLWTFGFRTKVPFVSDPQVVFILLRVPAKHQNFNLAENRLLN